MHVRHIKHQLLYSYVFAITCHVADMCSGNLLTQSTRPLHEDEEVEEGDYGSGFEGLYDKWMEGEKEETRQEDLV